MTTEELCQTSDDDLRLWLDELGVEQFRAILAERAYAKESDVPSTGDDLMDMAAECSRQNVKIERLEAENERLREEIKELKFNLAGTIGARDSGWKACEEARKGEDKWRREASCYDQLALIREKERDEARAILEAELRQLEEGGYEGSARLKRQRMTWLAEKK